MFKNVCFLSKLEAEKIQPDRDMAIISISCPDEINDDKPRLSSEWAYRLDLQFHDCSKQMDGVEVDVFCGYKVKLIAFTEDQARQVIEFCNKIDGKVDTVVVHCLAGISRSAAVAEFIRKHYTHMLRLQGSIERMNMHVYCTLENVYHEKIKN